MKPSAPINRMRIRKFMADGVPRTTRAVSDFIEMQRGSVEVHLRALEKEGFLQLVKFKHPNERVTTKVWQHVPQQPRNGTNPFEWKTYKQWEPS